jgi:hypothetical protein
VSGIIGLVRKSVDGASLASLVLGLAILYGIVAAIDWKFVRSLDFLAS